MGRHGHKFSFPLPGRKSHTKDKADNAKDGNLAPLTPSFPPPVVPEWSPRINDPGSYSKAERLLGTSGLPLRPSSRQTSVPGRSGYKTIAVSEASFGSEFTDKGSMKVVEGNLSPSKRPSMSNRPSSTVLNNAYNGDDRRLSNDSFISKHLYPRTSNSTLHSHYDAQNSPFYISQQTSDSAVRDRALRKGKPPVSSTHDSDIDQHGYSHVHSPLFRQMSDELRMQSRKGKPARLDLSRLFPKPKVDGGTNLLSPNKLVNSPSALSSVSEFFPRPMVRVPTLDVKKQAKFKRAAQRQQPSPSETRRPTSPVRLYKREQYDNAKLNIRRPPRGIRHWFDGISDESDEDPDEHDEHPIHDMKSMDPPRTYADLASKPSVSRLFRDSAASSQQTLRPHQPNNVSRREQRAPGCSRLENGISSPSQYSVQSHGSFVSNRTKESALSKSNLHNLSVLSMSSSEDDEDEIILIPNKFEVRASIDIPEDDGDITIGKAEAFAVRPRHTRSKHSEGKVSILSTSTNAATIEVMYTPEPYSPQLFPRAYNARRPSHIRQPSVIHEDEHARPKTSANRALSPSSISLRSARTSASEPPSRSDQHKLMVVTAEEEALLEMMRQKRSAMAKHSFTEGYKKANQQEVIRQVTPPEKAHRTSGFLANATPAPSPAQAAKSTSRKPLVGSPSPLLLPPRGRSSRVVHDSHLGTSVLRDSSSCDERESDRRTFSTSIGYAPNLGPQPEFLPLDLFPSSTPTASMASPTTTDHPSPLPSPVTPRLRHGESDFEVKVAGSEPSCNGDNDDLAVIDLGTIGPPSGGIKTDASRPSHLIDQPHQRRRTASSGADMTLNLGPSSFPAPPKSHSLASQLPDISISTSSFSDPGPRLPKKNPRRTSTLPLMTTANPAPVPVTRNRQGSIMSSRTSSPVPVSERHSSRVGSVLSHRNSINSLGSVNSANGRKRESILVPEKDTRSSVSEDVLAAWGSLGGV